MHELCCLSGQCSVYKVSNVLDGWTGERIYFYRLLQVNINLSMYIGDHPTKSLTVFSDNHGHFTKLNTLSELLLTTTKSSTVNNCEFDIQTYGNILCIHIHDVIHSSCKHTCRHTCIYNTVTSTCNIVTCRHTCIYNTVTSTCNSVTCRHTCIYNTVTPFHITLHVPYGIDESDADELFIQ